MATDFRTGAHESDRAGSGVWLISVSTDVNTLSIDGVGGNGFANRTVNIPLMVYANAERRKLGLHAGGVYIRFVSQEPGPQFSGPSFFVPVLRFFVRRNLMAGRTGLYRGLPVMITGVVPETYRN